MNPTDEGQRKAARSRRDELLTLVNGWDPAGRLEAGAPRDVYDFLIDDLLEVLSRHATHEEVTDFLDRRIRERFGSPPDDAPRFVKKAVTWSQLVSTERD